jgi:hypothetical protein
MHRKEADVMNLPASGASVDAGEKIETVGTQNGWI